MNWETQLISLYVYICKQFTNRLIAHCQRMSNNYQPDFTDEEVLTIYIFGILQEKYKVKQIYNYTRNHLNDWFPLLPSYQAFNARLNRLHDIFPALIEQILIDAPFLNVFRSMRLIDSMPVIIANAKRSNSAKVASEFANKGYCASKGIYFYGVKVHIVGFKRHNTLPVPEYIGLTPATDHDLTAFYAIASEIKNGELYADKAYVDELLKLILHAQNNLTLQTPFKKEKGQEELGSYEKLFSTAVNRVRQPIESLFNWIQEKTQIQFASKVRSYKGLLVHIFGRMTAAMFLLAFNS